MNSRSLLKSLFVVLPDNNDIPYGCEIRQVVGLDESSTQIEPLIFFSITTLAKKVLNGISCRN
jgi:hypothetical protein